MPPTTLVRVAVAHSSYSCSELCGSSLRGQQVEPLLALHSLLREGVVGGEASGVCADGGVVIGVIELQEVLVRESITYVEGIDSL